MREDLFEGLNEQQKEAVIHEGSPLLILAGAGSGKTTVITRKIAYLIRQKIVEPWNILAVTFTKKAANEMKERACLLEAGAAQSEIKTFHSFGAWFLRTYIDYTNLSEKFTVYDDDDSETLLKHSVPSLSSKEVKTAAKQIALAKDYGLLPEDDLSQIESDLDLNSIYAEYQKALRATGNVDFGDLIMLPYLILKQNEAVRERVYRRFKVIMVDEYQDTNIAQFNLLQELSGIKYGNDCYVSVVGDDDQSIYKFRGAEVRNILDFSKQFPNTSIVKLERNYRSTSQILDVANLVIKKNSDRLDKTLISDRGEGKQPVYIYIDNRFPYDNKFSYIDEEKEIITEEKFVAELIEKSLKEKKSYSDWAVLFRTNAQATGFEKEFIRRKIPYRIFGSIKLYERAEIKDVIAYLSLFQNHRDVVAFRRIINKPTRTLGAKTQEQILLKSLNNTVENKSAEDNEQSDENIIFKDLFEVMREMITAKEFSKKAGEGAASFINIFDNFETFIESEKHLSDFIKLVIERSGILEYYKTGDKIEDTQTEEYLQSFIDSAVPYEKKLEERPLRELLTEFLDSINLERTLAEEEEETTDYVTLMTLHNTKGLEFNKVIITGVEEGVFPRFGKVGIELEEERRLFYVGITRAKNELFVTSTARRALYGHWEFMQPSQFLKDAKDAFRILGNPPFGFSQRIQPSYGGNYSQKETDSPTEEDDSFAAKWKRGTKIYHDDYGEGYIIKSGYNEGELVINVQFQTGEVKKFLPAYQSAKLTIIRD